MTSGGGSGGNGIRQSLNFPGHAIGDCGAAGIKWYFKANTPERGKGMVLDTLENGSRYFGLHEGFRKAFEPEDAHLPLVSAGEIHKVVVKVAVDGIM